MTLFARKIVAFAVAFLGLAGSGHALEMNELSKLRPDIEIVLPLLEGETYVANTVKLSEIGKFKDTDGSEWLRLEGSTSAGDAVMAYIDILDASLDVAITIAELELDDLHVDLGRIRTMARSRSGTLEYADQHYQFSGFGRSKFNSSSGAEGNVAFFIFQSDEDKDLSLMILAWGDRIEVFQNERVSSKTISIK